MKKPVKRPKKRNFDDEFAVIFRELEQIRGDIDQMQKYMGHLYEILRARGIYPQPPTLKPAHYSDVSF